MEDVLLLIEWCYGEGIQYMYPIHKSLEMLPTNDERHFQLSRHNVNSNSFLKLISSSLTLFN